MLRRLLRTAAVASGHSLTLGATDCDVPFGTWRGGALQLDFAERALLPVIRIAVRSLLSYDTNSVGRNNQEPDTEMAGTDSNQDEPRKGRTV
jgi:hypothetical protein